MQLEHELALLQYYDVLADKYKKVDGLDKVSNSIRIRSQSSEGEFGKHTQWKKHLLSPVYSIRGIVKIFSRSTLKNGWENNNTYTTKNRTSQVSTLEARSHKTVSIRYCTSMDHPNKFTP